MPIMSGWSNFWIDRQKYKHEKMVEDMLIYVGMAPKDFRRLSLQDQNYLIDSYKQTLGKF